MREVVDAIAPDLKAGFRKRRNTFNRAASTGVVHVVNFQMARYAVPPTQPVPQRLKDGSFTVNLGVHGRSRPDRPTNNWRWVNEYDCEPRARLGALLPKDDPARALNVFWPFAD